MILHIYIKANIVLCVGIGKGSGSTLLVVFFVLTITFCLVSAGIFKANTTIGMAAYAKKSKGSSGGSSSGGGESKRGSDGGGSKGDDGSSGGGGGSGSNKGGDNGGSGSSGNTGGETGGDNNNPTTGEPNVPPPPPSLIEEPPPTFEQPPAPPPGTCEQGSTAPECSRSTGPATPPGTCEQGSTAPECSRSTGPATPPGPIDCNTSPSDPSCKTTTSPGGPVDCNTNPNDPSCGPQPPVDCKANPDDASCTTPLVDCTSTPNDPSCKPDCTKNSQDPSCKVDCTANPNDPSCPPPPCQEGSSDCTPPCQSAVIGISCPPPPSECNSDEHLDNGKCVKNGPGPDDDCLFNPNLSKCKANCDENNFCQCPQGFSMNEDDNCFPNKKCPQGYERHNEDETGKCFPISCPSGQHFDAKVNKCVPDIISCPKGQHYDTNLKKCIIDCPKDQHFNPILNRCVPDCPPGFHLENKVCTKTVVKHVTIVETVVRNFGISNQPSSYTLLLDTAQLCQLAGDTQCVAKQNQFNTLNLVTKLDSTGKTWTITGQVENRVSKTQNNVQVIGYFYDSKGNSVGGPYKGTVNPTVLKNHQLGAFSMKPSISNMKGTPSFFRLEYQSTVS